ncbi:hypothetical protein KL910_003424 [Ogataea haglerorum]|nr:hypothetical protein KL910_003424 [Ogataea haglerorum]
MESKRRVHGTAQRQKTELCVRGSVLVQPDVYADPYEQVADVARLGHHRVKTLAIHEVLELVAVVEQREDHYAPGGPDQPLQHALLLGRGDLGDDQKNHAVDRPGSEALDRSGDYEHQHRLGRAAQNTAQAEHGQGDQHDGLSSAALGGLAADRDHRGLGQSERSGTQVAALALSVNWVDMVESATVTTVWSRAARKIAITRPPMISLRSV